ncbi:MAG: hypothetical protein NZ561_08830 [Phycisphaerae bacterium]|nr:hypothetical protein [Phycisphaerae bacterium]
MDCPALNRLIRASRLRWSAAQLAESAAAGALAGCVAGGASAAWLTWQGEPSVLVTAGLIALGTICGGLVSLAKLPSLATTARRLDAQHLQKELFSTAHELTQGGKWFDSAIGQAVLAQAEAMAARRSPRDFRFSRWSGRAFGACVVAVGLTLTLSAIGSSHVDRPILEAEGAAVGRDPGSHRPAESKDRVGNLVGTELPGRQRARGQVAESLRRRVESRGAGEWAGLGRQASSESKSTDGRASGEGGGFSRTEAPQALLDRAPLGQAGPGGSSDRRDAQAGGGAFERVDGSTQSTPAAEPAAAEAAGVHLAADESGRMSPSARRTVLRMLRQGEIPAEYRAIVREYFLRD